MPDITPEKKLADYLAKALDTLSLDPHHAVYMLNQRRTAIHRNMFDLVLAYINSWAYAYQSGDLKPTDNMYNIAETCAIMTDALNPAPPRGRHASV